MAFLYYTTNQQKMGFYNGSWSTYMSAARDANLEKFVSNGILKVDDIPEVAIEVGNDDIPSSLVMTAGFRDREGKLATSGDFCGVIAQGANSGELARVVNSGNVAIKNGPVKVNENSAVVVPFGVTLEYDDTGIVHIDGKITSANGDFHNSVWSDVDSKIVVSTSADDETARGITITVLFLDNTGRFTTEELVLDETDSSVAVTSTKDCSALIALYTSASITTANLVVADEDANACITLTTPTENSYGVLLCDVVPSSYRKVKITSDVEMTGNLILFGADKNNSSVLDIIPVTAALTATSNIGFKKIDLMYVGDDGAATATYTVEVEADSEGDIIGHARFGDIAANSVGMITLK